MSFIPPLLVPTRNRPTALAGLLKYLSQFYPDCRVIVADGSSEFHQIVNNEIIQSSPLKSIEYIKFPSTLSLPERLINILENDTSPYFIMGADDDYPILESFAGAADFLEKNPAYSIAVGPSLKLNFLSTDQLTAILDIPRQLPLKKPQFRCMHFSKWSFPTTYSIARREVLIDRYKMLNAYFLPGFVDFTIGLVDSLHGKIATLPNYTFIRTSHFNASHLRPRSGTGFLNDATQIMNLQTHFANVLSEKSQINSVNASALVNRMFCNRIAELCGRREPLENVIINTKFDTTSPLVQAELFNDLFREGTSARDRYAARLEMIANNLYAAADSNDNLDEPQKVFSPDAQQTQKPPERRVVKKEKIGNHRQASVVTDAAKRETKKVSIHPPSFKIKLNPQTLKIIDTT